MGSRQWVMMQEWHDLLFLHWPVPAGWLEDRIPEELELDLFDGEAWVGVVPFKAKATRLRFGPPIPGLKEYLELNVRTYVKYHGQAGVYFFSLDADSPLAVSAASFGGFLPYRRASIEMERHGNKTSFISRCTERGEYPEELRLEYSLASGTVKANPLEIWLTERYCLWTKPKTQLYRVDIEHSPWELNYIKGEIYRNSMAAFLPYDLHSIRPLAHSGGSQRVRFYPPVREKT
ncbi:YqjF family protein [Planococcus sp. FY231025]|uniref:YqjF family protein n=1 Tax=Planococcus sp. FY231025 TaxID=3455699 RepID=UPI003F8E28AB